MLPGSPQSFATSVFVNCRFDDKYRALLRAILYTIIALGFRPRCTLESDDSEPRIIKLLELVRSCRYGIHDISMQALDEQTGLPRFNMPFELGLFFGCKHFSSADEAQQSKRFLILDSDPHRFRSSLSDLAGFEISAHSNSPELCVRAVRDWFAVCLQRPQLPASQIWAELQSLEKALPALAGALGYHPDTVPFTDLVFTMRDWALNQEIHPAPAIAAQSPRADSPA